MLLLWVVVFVVSLLVLIKGADYFTDCAERIGIYFGMPNFIVGVTIVAIGTSLPELISSIFAVVNNSSELVVGNVLGSNITNIFLILGITAIISKKLRLTYDLLSVDLPMLAGSAMLLAIMIWDGNFTLGEAIVSIVGFSLYMVYAINVEKKDKELKRESKKSGKKLSSRTWAILGVSLVLIYFGAEYTVKSVVEIAGILKIGVEIIAVSAVALGTSLPELIVSITAAAKSKPEIAVGNILGSNMFNTFVVMGVPALFGVLIIPASMLTFALPMMLIATLLYFFMTQARKISQWEGWVLILFYVVFIGKLFSWF